MSAWDELVTTALLGTERRPLPTMLPEAVDRLASAQDDRALAVLDAAAGYAAFLAAGARPGTAPEPPLAPRLVLDPAPEPAHRLLAMLLEGREVPLVEEWLRRCTSHGLGVRAGLWTPLATAAAGPRGPDRALVREAVGERGRAFLALNPRWRAVARGRTTRNPDREAVSWSQELTAQAAEVVSVTRSLGRRRITVGPDADLVRRTLAGADLDVWERHTGLAPDAFLELLRAGAGDRFDGLVAALADAAHAQHHVGWGCALVRSGFVRADLVGVVPSGDWSRIVRRWVDDRRDADQVARLLTFVPGPWDDDVAEAALRHLTSGRLGAASSRRTLPVAALRLPLSALGLVSRYAEEERKSAARAGVRGFAEAARVLGLRRAIDRSFRTDHEESP